MCALAVDGAAPNKRHKTGEWDSSCNSFMYERPHLLKDYLEDVQFVQKMTGGKQLLLSPIEWMCPFQSQRCKGAQCRMVKGVHGVSKIRQHLVDVHPRNPLARLLVMRYDALRNLPASTTIARLDDLVDTPSGFPFTRADLTLTQAFVDDHEDLSPEEKESCETIRSINVRDMSGFFDAGETPRPPLPHPPSAPSAVRAVRSPGRPRSAVRRPSASAASRLARLDRRA